MALGITRKLNEEIVFRDVITGLEVVRFIVSRIGRSEVKVDIAAANHIHIVRGEHMGNEEKLKEHTAKRLEVVQQNEVCEMEAAAMQT